MNKRLLRRLDNSDESFYFAVKERKSVKTVSHVTHFTKTEFLKIDLSTLQLNPKILQKKSKIIIFGQKWSDSAPKGVFSKIRASVWPKLVKSWNGPIMPFFKNGRFRWRDGSVDSFSTMITERFKSVNSSTVCLKIKLGRRVHIPSCRWRPISGMIL